MSVGCVVSSCVFVLGRVVFVFVLVCVVCEMRVW